MNTQYHLTGRGHSNRAVRVRELQPEDIEENLTSAAKLLGEGATLLELKKTEWRNGVKLMLAEISEPCSDPMQADVKWRKVQPVDLVSLGDFFKAKDVLILEAMFRREYEITPAEVEAIAGKGLPVSGG